MIQEELRIDHSSSNYMDKSIFNMIKIYITYLVYDLPYFVFNINLFAFTILFNVD